MIEMSLCMIVKNEEEVLNQCLTSIAHLCDEIIIVDTGSTDGTKEIAQKFTNKVIDFKWIDNFSAARNFAFSHATKDYIIWLDADDILLKADQEKLKMLKQTLSNDIDFVSFIYNIAFDEYGNPTFSYRRNRLVKRAKGFTWKGVVHEYLDVAGNSIYADIAVTHRKIDKTRKPPSDRNLRIYEQRLNMGEAFSPRDLYYYANELKDHGKYRKATVYYQEFLATKKGWVEDQIRACLNMANCYRALEQPDKQMEALVMSFIYDNPRPEISCQLGDIYTNRKQFKKAIFWYKSALEVEIDNNSGFHEKSYSTWYPHLQLCVCYWTLGDKKASVEHHNLAKKYRPNEAKILYNEKFFNDYFKNQDANK
ncbi:glycosyltransferase family 2 protein [Priestia filamentosa]|uniref:glycosyltransferase n=1 Tax=Priestia filamentosa TaxID=1402861 RepID=UPI00397BA9F7